jgi:hypothetical protein
VNLLFMGSAIYSISVLSIYKGSDLCLEITWNR